MRPQKGDILIAFKAIALCPNLRNNDRPVAAALLDHYNRKSGRCDPGLERLSVLLGISERTVMRSLDRIEAARLFKRIRHGGNLNRNSYEPNWVRVRELESVWSGRMRVRSHCSENVSPDTRQGCHLDGDGSVTQTCRSNQSNTTCENGLPTKEFGQGTQSRAFDVKIAQSTDRSDAARTAAERRWQSELHREFRSMPVTYGEIIDALDQEMLAAATEAELRRHGAGLTYIINKLSLRGGAATRSSHG